MLKVCPPIEKAQQCVRVSQENLDSPADHFSHGLPYLGTEVTCFAYIIIIAQHFLITLPVSAMEQRWYMRTRCLYHALLQLMTGSAVPVKSLLLGAIWLYQKVLSPWIGNQCRFYPTCSEYARQAVATHGSLRGSALAAKRLCKCHPWHPGGFDYVPGAVPGAEPDQEQHQCTPLCNHHSEDHSQ